MRANAVRAAVAIVASTMLTSWRSLTDGETRFLSAYYWLDQGATRRVDLAPVRITCLTSAGSDALSKALQPFGVETTTELTPRSREDLEAKSSEGDVEDSPGDADAITIGNTIFFRGKFCSSDFAPEYPKKPKSLEQSLLAHEVIHVWQQQHTSLTGYSLMSIIAEHVRYGDEAYRYEPLVPNRSILSYRLEQQARMMQDYAYWKLQGDLRYKKLEPLLRQAFGVDRRRAGPRAARSVRPRCNACPTP
jgi:hypothetical protein